MRVALYLRRSTDEVLQADSIDAQEALVRRYAEENQHEIVGEPFVDNASGRTADRADFQRLIDVVAKGAPFQGVLVRDVTRWGRFLNVDEGAFWEFYFITHGVRVLYVQEGFRDESDPFASIQKTLRRFVAAEFSREKSRLLQYGKYRSVSKGFWKGGAAPFGMRRILVTPEGRRLRRLKDGERKVISDERVKLEPGAPADVATVKRIFRLYLRGITAFRIARILNRSNVRSPRGARWTFSSIAIILSNAAYAGMSAAQFSISDNFRTPQFVATPDAWTGIVSRAAWERAQQITAERRRRRTPAGLAERLREFFDEHGHIDDRKGKRPSAETLAKHFERGGDEALEAAALVEFTGAREKVVAALRHSFRVEDEGSTVILDGVVRLGFAIAVPRGHSISGVQWRFKFTGLETQDVTIAIGLGPSLRPAAYFRYVNLRWRRKSRVMAPRLSSESTRSASRSLDQIIAGIRRDLFRYSSMARERFLAAVRDLTVVNTYEVARSLGWKEESGLSLYKRLQRDGAYLPPLAKQFGKRIDLVCDDCGKVRRMRLGDARLHKSSLCAPCTRKRRERYRRCPACGVRRDLNRKAITAALKPKYKRTCRTCGGRLSRPISHARRQRDERGRYLSEKNPFLIDEMGRRRDG